VTAIAHSGASGSQSSYSYLWKLNGDVLFGGPIKGKQTAELTMPRYQDGYISVLVIDPQGKTIGEKAISLTPSDPELYFYENNPLRGLYRRPIADIISLVGDETEIYAEPYFMNTTLTNTDTVYEWSIDNSKVQNDNFNSIVLRKEGNTGSARIDTRIFTKSEIPQYITGAFTISF
jgi:hypothetical protein